ncbi:DUF1566 domain-containing protein [Pseudoduganella sp. LjRoot289]|uniref:Lcl domain-containing protein n=1 Tax=Pseudoduganella sp. LjRoot289 TaxID=3342314 RepID=UPI003ECEE696
MSVNNFSRWVSCLGLAFSCTANSSQAEGMAGWKDLGNAVLAQDSTKLSWTKTDNGQEVNWEEAKAYCARLGAGWRLPLVDELSGLYEQARRDGDSAACGNASCKVPPLFTLSGNWYWSGTDLKKDSSEASPVLVWGVLLVNGTRNQTFKFAPYGTRALCVRAS